METTIASGPSYSSGCWSPTTLTALTLKVSLKGAAEETKEKNAVDATEVCGVHGGEGEGAVNTVNGGGVERVTLPLATPTKGGENRRGEVDVP